MAARIYDRPDLDQDVYQPALYVTGRFARAKPSLAYEGRLQIRNSIGGCSVLQIGGDKLPDGTQVRVDQATKEVVVAWPAYLTAQAPIANPDFEQGQTGWELGPGWNITTENPPSGQWSAGYWGNWGTSRISNAARYTVQPGQITTAKCDVRQGASSEGNAGGSVMLEYRNAAGEVIHTVEGNQVMSASKNRVYPSSVFGAAPPGAATINVAGNGIRYRENKILFVDNFQWDHTVPSAGINFETVLNVVLRVNDSTGRSFVWSGPITVALRPLVYRLFIKLYAPILLSMGYNHASNTVTRLGSSDHPGPGNVYRIGATPDATLVAVTWTAAPGIRLCAVSPQGVIGDPLPNLTPSLPDAGRCVEFSPSGAAILIGHDGSPYIRAHRVSPLGFGAAYAPPSSLPPGPVISMAFNPKGDIVYTCSGTYPFFAVYRWSDETGFGERLPATVPLPASAPYSLAINESGSHLAVLASTPACHIYKIGVNGMEERIAAIGSNGATSGKLAFSDAAGAVAWGTSFGDDLFQAFLWDPIQGVGQALPAPPGLPYRVINAQFSKDGMVLYVGVTTNRGLLTYEWSKGVGTTRGPVDFGGTACGDIVAID